MSAALPSPNPKALHLLRALLRQASYLPDATARSLIRQHIVNRFKAYQPRPNAAASFDVHALQRYRHNSFKRRQLAVIHARTRPLLRQARKSLNYLRRANQGEIPCLQKVLFFAYGRMGRRKYALLNDLLRPDPDVTAEDLANPSPLQALYHSNRRYLQYFDAPKASSKTHHAIHVSRRYSRLRAVLISQSQQGIAIHRELKGPALKTPINNTWERPMPIKRARNNVRRWYAETMTRLLPPLPNDEWDNMHAMALGEKPISLRRRRTPALELNPQPNDQQHQLKDALLDAMALDKPSRADKPAGMQRPHAVTVKFMRRLYSKILALCCKLEYDEKNNQWNAIWGEARKTISPTLYAAPTDESLFAGVDAAGRVPKSSKKPNADPNSPAQLRTGKGDYTRFPFFTEFLPADHPMRKELEAWKKRRATASASESASASLPGR